MGGGPSVFPLGGAHFPHDVAAGQKLAPVIFAKMKESAAFQRELAAARAELKRPNPPLVKKSEIHCIKAPCYP